MAMKTEQCIYCGESSFYHPDYGSMVEYTFPCTLEEYYRKSEYPFSCFSAIMHNNCLLDYCAQLKSSTHNFCTEEQLRR